MNAPSPWILRWAHLMAPGGTVLDVAAGSGRHTMWLAARGCRVVAVDRDGEAMRPLSGRAEVVVADLENAPWPFADRRFDAIVVANYLWRPLFPPIVAGSLIRSLHPNTSDPENDRAGNRLVAARL